MQLPSCKLNDNRNIKKIVEQQRELNRTHNGENSTS